MSIPPANTPPYLPWCERLLQYKNSPLHVHKWLLAIRDIERKGDEDGVSYVLILNCGDTLSVTTNNGH